MLNKDLSESKQLINQRRCCRIDIISFQKLLSICWFSKVVGCELYDQDSISRRGKATSPQLLYGPWGPSCLLSVVVRVCCSGQTIAVTATVLRTLTIITAANRV